MSDKVVYPNFVTTLDLPPDRILQAAVGKLENVIVVGYDKERNEYFASNVADGGTTLWLLERSKKALLEMADET